MRLTRQEFFNEHAEGMKRSGSATPSQAASCDCLSFSQGPVFLSLEVVSAIGVALLVSESVL